MMSFSFSRFFKLCIVLVFVAAMTMSAVSCSSKGMPTQLKNNLEQVVGNAMQKYNIPGAIVGVWSPRSGDLIMSKGKRTSKPARI